ncbi:MAG: sulfatase-like hydrolase/transferase, partial [Planctomycetaceae bacterium]
FWRWDTPDKYQTNMRAYFRMLSGIDHVVGRLVQQLARQGLAANTVIPYTADNGYYLGDRGFAGKWTHYDQSLRVPLVVYDPRQPPQQRGKVRREFVLNSDLAATMISLAGQSVPDTHTGRSLVPLISGKTPAWRTDFLCEFLAVPRSIPLWEGVRATRWVYARYFVHGKHKPPFEFLHDLQDDPDQLINIAALPAGGRTATHTAALTSMRRRCDTLVKQHGPAMPQIPDSGKRRKKSKT